MVRWPPALSATSTQNTARTNCLQMSHAEAEGACVHANQCLVFRFFVFDCVVEGTSHCLFNFEPMQKLQFG